MPNHPDIVAVGASAGGVEAISKLLRALPDELHAVVLIVLHRPVERFSRLREVLSSQTRMPVMIPQEGEVLQPGVCYLGHPHRHLTIGDGLRAHYLPDHFYKSHNVDALFFSLALHAGKRTIGIVLSGMLNDGSLGLTAISGAGGIALVQSPDEATAPGMPRSAIAFGCPIHLIAPIDALAKEVCRLTRLHASKHVHEPAAEAMQRSTG